jgi:hypothetical protein
LPDCEANIARLALFAQQTGGAAAPSAAPLPGSPMIINEENTNEIVKEFVYLIQNHVDLHKL